MYVLENGASNVTLFPAQNIVAPFGVITGVAGNGFTVTAKGNDGRDVQPFELVIITE
jgi:hypothetical protein